MEEIDTSELLAINVLAKANIIKKRDFKKSESPDFISSNNSIGIEVTIANNLIAYGKAVIRGDKIENARNMEAYVKSIGGNVMSEDEAKSKNKYIMYRNQNNVYVSPDLDTGFLLINERIEGKLVKLQNYKKCKEYRLFIITPGLFIQNPTEINEEELELEIKNIERLYNKYRLKYNIIYLYTGNILYIVDMERKKFTYKYIKLDIDLLKKSNII